MTTTQQTHQTPPAAPTVGQIVLIYGLDPTGNRGLSHAPAIVTHVFPGGRINVTVFQDAGPSVIRLESVGTEVPGPTWGYPPRV